MRIHGEAHSEIETRDRWKLHGGDKGNDLEGPCLTTDPYTHALEKEMAKCVQHHGGVRAAKDPKEENKIDTYKLYLSSKPASPTTGIL